MIKERCGQAKVATKFSNKLCDFRAEIAPTIRRNSEELYGSCWRCYLRVEEELGFVENAAVGGGNDSAHEEVEKDGGTNRKNKGVSEDERRKERAARLSASEESGRRRDEM